MNHMKKELKCILYQNSYKKGDPSNNKMYIVLSGIVAIS